MKRIMLAGLAALTLGIVTAPAHAQYGYDDDRPRRFERRYDEDRGYGYERRRRYDEDRYDDRPRGYGRRSSICVTARGNCMTRPAPYNSPCGCEVPGFGFKRGQIGG
ncbi:hypothetical protein [Methylobacterium sp. sgz302541]|uniref:hypothetical protein n=1 Tax=unclassified Methylobacterium TaxID=2615210 RepID=UPI003D3273AA